jgi:LuxR family quorum-sensing system transcriptional regulator CciR
MLVSFETFVEKSNRARTTDELVMEFLGTVKQRGLDRMIFCLQTNHDHIDIKPGVGVIQNYPQDWMKHYFEKGYDRLDPVITYCQNKMDTFTWAEIPHRLRITRMQAQCLNIWANLPRVLSIRPNHSLQLETGRNLIGAAIATR